jgi:CHAD domain-containing protein
MSHDAPPGELRYDVADGVDLPPLGGMASGNGGAVLPVAAAEEFAHLEVTHFDTADRSLARAGITLRRGTGDDGTGDDGAGWLVALPGPDADATLRLPAGRSATTVPAAIRRLLWARSRGSALHPVARVITERSTHRLINADGAQLVVLTDDRVTGERLTAAASDPKARPLRESGTVRWRVVSVETEAGGWREAITAGLERAGARHADARTDLDRVWAGADPGRAGAAEDSAPADEPSPESPAGEVVLGYIEQQLEQILRSDPLVRLDSPGSVHRMRVATRRLRSALDTFRPVLSTETVKPLRPELKWLAGELGAARDAEVMRDRVLGALHTEDRKLHLGPLDSVGIEMDRSYRTAHDRLLRALASDRYHRLVLALHELSVNPPLTEKADRPARRVLPRRAARAYRRLESRVTTAHAAATSAERDARLHAARKAAKKARYAAETLTDFFGEPAARFAEAMETLQEELGEHQDSIVLRARVQELVRPETSAAEAFTYGRLHAQEQQRGDVAVEHFEAAWRQAKKKSVRAWLR